MLLFVLAFLLCLIEQSSVPVCVCVFGGSIVGMESKLVELLQKSNALEDGSLQKAVKEIMASRVLPDMLRAVELSLFSLFFCVCVCFIIMCLS